MQDPGVQACVLNHREDVEAQGSVSEHVKEPAHICQVGRLDAALFFLCFRNTYSWYRGLCKFGNYGGCVGRNLRRRFHFRAEVLEQGRRGVEIELKTAEFYVATLVRGDDFVPSEVLVLLGKAVGHRRQIDRGAFGRCALFVHPADLLVDDRRGGIDLYIPCGQRTAVCPQEILHPSEFHARGKLVEGLPGAR